MEITMTKFKTKLTVELEGKLDANSAPELEAKIEPELKNTDILIFDLHFKRRSESTGVCSANARCARRYDEDRKCIGRDKEGI